MTQILVHPESGLAGRTLRELCDDTVVILGLVREDGTYLSRPGGSEELRLADEVFLYGPDDTPSTLAQTQAERPGGGESSELRPSRLQP